jgi:hypothetical protein
VDKKHFKAEGVALVIFGAVLVYLFLGINIFNFTPEALKFIVGLLGIFMVLRGVRFLFKGQ